MTSYGIVTDADGELAELGVPIRYVDALPGAGNFPGEHYWLRTGAFGLYGWTGSAFVGPYGTGGGGGSGDMLKAVYDTDNDGRVDKAESVDDGTNVKSAAQVAGHIDDTANPHATSAAQVGAPPTGRLINTTFPLSGGGDLSADRTLAIANGTIALAKIEDIAAGNVLARVGGSGSGPPVQVDLLATPGVSRVPYVDATGTLPLGWVRPHSTMGALYTNSAGAVAYVNHAAASSLIFQKDGASTPVAVRIGTGSSFPASPCDGQMYWHPVHLCWYVFDAATAGWLSSHIYEFEFGIDADTAATAFLKFGDQAGDTLFSSTIGHLIGAQTKVVGISLNMAATPAATVTVQVFAGGTAVTGATLSLTTAQQSKADELLMSNAIAASSILGVKVTAGTIKGPARGKVRLRRFET